MISRQGTDISAGLDVAQRALERGAEEAFSGKKDSSSSHVMILISDGEDQEDQAIEMAKRIKESGVRFYALGIGTEKGGPIPIQGDADASRGFKKDSQGQPIISQFRPQFLEQLTASAGGKYWTISAAEAEIQDLLSDLGTLNRREFEERRYTVYEYQYQWPLGVAIVLLLIELFLPASLSVNRSVKKALLIFLLFSASTVRAEGWSLRPGSMDAYLENEKGIQAYKDGKLDEAKKSFGSAQAREPSQPELEFNQGVIELNSELNGGRNGGSVDQAIESFKNAARLSKERKNDALLGKTYYNLGKAFTKKGNLEEAAKFYASSAEIARQIQDRKTENESRKNLELLAEEQKKQQQKKQQQKKQEQQDQKKQDQKQQQQQQQEQQQEQKDQKQQQQEQKNQQEQQEQKDQKQKKQQEQKDQQNQQQQQEQKEQKDQQQQDQAVEPKKGQRESFESKKMSPEDADRVISELKNQERMLREKIQQNKSRPQANKKDW
jgi:Ca-activated chloride channel family protein